MVKIGWLADQVGITGGAEISGSMLLSNAPDWAEVVFCPANRRPPDDIDVWVLQNVVTYQQRWIEPLDNGGKVIKHFRDPWHPGDPIFRRWVLDHARLLIFNSKLAIESTPWPSRAAEIVVPPPVDLQAFRMAALPPDDRSGNVFVGRVDIAKGIHRAIDWALTWDEPLDVYGQGAYPWASALPDTIRFHGPQPYTRMPQIFGEAQRFVFLPGAVESYSRTTVEAWAAGCDLVVDWSKIGAREFIFRDAGVPEMDEAATMFWAAVAGAIDEAV